MVCDFNIVSHNYLQKDLYIRFFAVIDKIHNFLTELPQIWHTVMKIEFILQYLEIYYQFLPVVTRKGTKNISEIVDVAQ